MTLPTPTVVFADPNEVLAFSRVHHDEVFFEPTAIAAEKLFAGIDGHKTERLSEGVNFKRYAFFLKLDDEIIGWHIARQQNALLFSMEGSGILPAFRGRGFYRYLLDAVVREARSEGYAAIVSTHAADNNRILVPKLRYGFVIKGFEINPMYGLDVKLIYYFSEGQKKAHAIRVGSRALFEET